MTVVEIGVSKRGIEYLSDVLNTAARIQGICNEYNAKFLESVQLKGKTEHVDIHRVQPL